MSDAVDNAKGPVDTSNSLNCSFQVLPQEAIQFKSGFWADRQGRNHKVSLKHGYAMLPKAGNFHNLRMAAGLDSGSFRGMNFASRTP